MSDSPYDYIYKDAYERGFVKDSLTSLKLSDSKKLLLRKLGIGLEVLGTDLLCGPLSAVYQKEGIFVDHLLNCHDFNKVVEEELKDKPNLILQFKIGTCNTDCTFPFFREMLISNFYEIYYFSGPRIPMIIPPTLGRKNYLLEEGEIDMYSEQDLAEIREHFGVIFNSNHELAIFSCEDYDEDFVLNTGDFVMFYPNSSCGMHFIEIMNQESKLHGLSDIFRQADS